MGSCHSYREGLRRPCLNPCSFLARKSWPRRPDFTESPCESHTFRSMRNPADDAALACRRGGGRTTLRRRRRGCRRQANGVVTPPPPAPRPHQHSKHRRTNPHDRSPPPTRYRAVSYATSRPASSTTKTPPSPSNRPHTPRRPLPVTGPSTAPRGQLRGATRGVPASVTACHVHTTFDASRLPTILALSSAFKFEKKTPSRAPQVQVPQSTLSFLSRCGRMQHTSSFLALLKHRSPI